MILISFPQRALVLHKISRELSIHNNEMKMTFSDNYIEGYNILLKWLRKNDSPEGGNWYYCPRYDIEGWLCPALFLYFPSAPSRIYFKIERKS